MITSSRRGKKKHLVGEYYNFFVGGEKDGKIGRKLLVEDH